MAIILNIYKNLKFVICFEFFFFSGSLLYNSWPILTDSSDIFGALIHNILGLLLIPKGLLIFILSFLNQFLKDIL